MAIPVVITVASLIGRRALVAVGVRGLQAAFVSGGLRGFLVALVKKAAAWLLTGYLISVIWNFFFQAVITLYNFDWNASDEELDQQLNGALNQLASLAGSATGATLGWVVCGAVAGSVVVKINPVAAAQIIDELGEEAAEEIVAAWTALLRASLAVAFRGFLIWGYKNLRRFVLKPALGAITTAIFGEDKFANWGASNGPRVTMAETVENFFEDITPDVLQNFLESAWEEFWDACAEVGFLTVSLLENFGQYQNQTMRENVIGQERTVEISPDREAQERIILSGNERALMPAIVSTLATHQLIEQKDIGKIVGKQAEDSYIKTPDDLILYIQFYSVSEPPLNRVGVKLQEVNIKIPQPKRTALDWQQIKLAAGGSNGYFYGPRRVTCKLSNGGNTTIYAATHEEAEQRAEALFLLSDVTITSKTLGEDVAGGNRSLANDNLKQVIRMYPYSATIVYANRTTNPDRGRVRLSDGERVQYQEYSFLLWPEVPPVDFTENVNNLFITSNA